MTDLVTKNEYKTYRGVNSSNDDSRLDSIIPMVSNLVKTYCGKSFIDYYASNKTEYFTLKWSQQAIFLSENPIVNIVSIEERSAGDSYTALVEDDDYVIDTNIDAIYRVDTGVPIDFPIGINSVKVVYKAGYSETPADLKMAIFDLVTYYLKDQYLPEKNHASFTIRYNPDQPNFPEHIKRVLDMYKNV